jgi:hypothetical protein
MESIYKEVSLPWFKVTLQNLSVWSEENHEYL